MNTRTVDPRTIWALLAMEVGLALPLMSLPTQGDRIPGVLGPLLADLLGAAPCDIGVGRRSARVRGNIVTAQKIPTPICVWRQPTVSMKCCRIGGHTVPAR